MENTTTSFADAASAARIAEMTAPIPKKKGFSRAKLQENLWGWIFVAAILIGTTIFTYIAFILSIWISFTDYDAYIMTTFWEGLGSIHPEGAFYWYQYMFTPEGIFGASGEMENFWNTMGSTVFYLIGIPIGMILSLAISVMMTRDIKFTGTYRVIYYIPTVASTVSIAVMWANLFGSGGLMSTVFGIDLLSNTSNYWDNRICIIILTVWKGLGGTVVLFVAGLNGVNASYHEAAEIDGANAWQIFWRITMPQLYPTIFYVLVTSVIGGMQIFVEPNLIFGNFPATGNQATSGTEFNTPFVGYIFGVFNNGEWAHASALGIILAIIIFILTLIQFALDAKKEKD